MSTCNHRSDLQTLGSQPILPKKTPLSLAGTSYFKCSFEDLNNYFIAWNSNACYSNIAKSKKELPIDHNPCSVILVTFSV